MRRFVRPFVIGLIIVTVPATWAWAGYAQVVAGSRNVNNDFSPLDTQDVIGVNVFFAAADWQAVFQVGFLSASDQQDLFDPLSGLTVDTEVDTTELYVGAAKIWDQFPKVRPYVGGGLTAMEVEVQGSAMGVSVKEDDRSLSPYLGGGVFWMLGKGFHAGVDGRYVALAVVDLLGESNNAGYLQFAGLVGWGW